MEKNDLERTSERKNAIFLEKRYFFEKNVIFLKKCDLFVSFDILGQTTFEGVDWAPGDESEKLVFVFFVVSLSGESASDPLWDVGGSLGPDLLVQVSIYSDISGSHLDESEFFDGFDGLGGSEFSAGSLLSVESFVEVDGVLPGDDLLHSGSLSF